jgi:hypothetical protein
LSNPAKRREYDRKGILYVQDPNVVVGFFFFFLFYYYLVAGGLFIRTVCLTTSGLPESAQGFNTYLQWSWY